MHEVLELEEAFKHVMKGHVSSKLVRLQDLAISGIRLTTVEEKRKLSSLTGHLYLTQRLPNLRQYD